MKVLYLNCGLGNQIMEYIFKRYVELRYNEDVFIDDSYFTAKNVPHNGLELDKLFPNIKLKMFKDNFDKDVWDYMLKTMYDSGSHIRIPDILLDNGINVKAIVDEWFYPGNTDPKRYKFKGEAVEIDAIDLYNKDFKTKEVFDEKGNIIDMVEETDTLYYLGVWFCEKYGEAIKKEIEHELKFKELIHKENIAYKDDILSKEVSVGVHVRRGDFIEYDYHKSAGKYGNIIKTLKYDLIKQNKKPSFFVFSDNLQWCKENKSSLKFNDSDDVVFVEGNDVDARNYIDMQLMTFCDYLISPEKSTFALAAKMISEKDITLFRVI